MRKTVLRVCLCLLFLSLLPFRLVHAQTTTSTDETASATAAPADTERDTSSDAQTNSSATQDGTYERAIVHQLKLGSEVNQHGAEQKQEYEIEFLSGPLVGKTRLLSSDIDANPYRLELSPGDRVVVLLQTNPNGSEPLAYLEGFDRRGAMLWLIILFIATMTLLAGWQGIKVAASIVISIVLIGWILIPAFLKGLNPIPIAILLSGILATISSVFSTGWNKKSLITIVGTIGGVIVAYAISYFFSNWAHLNGLASEEDRMFFDKNPLLNARGLMFAGIIIAAMGVVEDVAVSIASGVYEVAQANRHLSFKQLFRSGMTVGRDHMSALANTLIFAYVGASLSTLLLYTQYGGSWLKFLNFDSVVDEIVRSLSGTIGLVFTVPITALLAAIIISRQKDTVHHTHTSVEHI